MSQPILIANVHPVRRRRLVDALRSKDIEVKAVRDGASALELALSHRPALIVAESELPLVEAPKLAEILRANPRTRGARFVFLGDAPQAADGAVLGDVFLPRNASIADVVATVEAELAIQQRLASFNQQVEERERPSGAFPELKLLEVMHCLHVWKRSGRLDLWQGADQDRRGRGSVWLCDGEVVDAEVGAAKDRKALYRLMQWERGRFELDPAGMNGKLRPLAPLRPLLGEGVRQLSEWARLGDRLPSADDSVGLRLRAAELPSILHPLTQEVLSLLELHGTVRDVVDKCSYPDYQVLRTLRTLADRQIVDLRTAASALRPDTPLFDEQQIRRLNDWAVSGPGQSADSDLKLLVAASCPAALADFTGLLRRVPGASVSADFDSGRADLSSLAPLARLAGESGVGIELINVPTQRELAPLWPIIGSGALGTLFLLSGSVGEAASNVKPMFDALRRPLSSRIFNLYLIHKDEPISPSELSENPSLIDEASLFVVQLEGGKSPVELLRSVFARVIP